MSYLDFPDVSDLGVSFLECLHLDFPDASVLGLSLLKCPFLECPFLECLSWSVFLGVSGLPTDVCFGLSII